jgi:hypothetical protein
MVIKPVHRSDVVGDGSGTTQAVGEYAARCGNMLSISSATVCLGHLWGSSDCMVARTNEDSWDMPLYCH